MAGNDTAALVVALSAQLTKFEKDLDNAVGIADRGARRIEERFEKMNIGRGFDDLIRSVARLAALGGLAEVTNRLHEVVASVAQIGDVARTVGVTTDQLQALRFAAISSGESFEKIDGGLERFGRAASEAARGNGDLYQILRANNVALKDSAGNLLSTAQLLEKFAGLIRNAKSPADALNIAIQAFGRQAGPAFVRVFTESSESIDQWIKKGREAGVVIDKEFIERAQKLQKQWDLTWQQLKVPMQEFAVLFVETMKKGISVLLDDINSLGAAAIAAFKRVTGEVSSFQEGLRAVGIEKLKAGQGTSLTGDVRGFPGQGPPNILINKSAGTTVLPDAQTEAFKKLIEAQRTRIQLLEVEADTVGKTAGEEASYKTLIELIGQAKQKQIPLDDKRLQQLQDEAERTGRAAQELDDYKRQWQGINSAAQFAGNELIDILDGLRNKTLSASDAARQLANSLIRALEQAVLLGSGPLGGVLGLSSKVQGGTGGLIGSLLSSFTSGGGGTGGIGHAAGGGSFGAGDFSVVGENGPELVRFGANGQVLPNSVFRGGGGGMVVQINNYTSPDTETRSRNQSGPNGDTVVIDIVKRGMARGEFDGVNRARNSLRPRKVI